MKPLEVAAVVLFISAGIAYSLFNFTTILGPYGMAGDVYHEIILAAIITMATVFLLIARKAGAFEI